jgi:hypothetical protein
MRLRIKAMQESLNTGWDSNSNHHHQEIFRGKDDDDDVHVVTERRGERKYCKIRVMIITDCGTKEQWDIWELRKSVHFITDRRQEWKSSKADFPSNSFYSFGLSFPLRKIDSSKYFFISHEREEAIRDAGTEPFVLSSFHLECHQEFPVGTTFDFSFWMPRTILVNVSSRTA